MRSARGLVAVVSSAALAVGGCGGGGETTHRVSLSVSSPSALVDAPVELRMRGLGSHETATVRATWTAFGGTRWASSENVRADATGTVNLTGFEGMRFLWAMRPTGPLRGGATVFLPPARGTTTVALTALVDGKTVARAQLPRRATSESVRLRALTVERDGLFGFLFTPRGSGRHPAVVLLGGSEGGYSMIDAAGLLAAHGYPALALAYFAAPGLPSRLSNIRLEYFQRAIRFLVRQPSVDPRHVVVLGESRGGEAALLLASTFPTMTHGAIGLVPSSEVNESPDRGVAWTYRGKPVPLAPIAVERINGPVLTVGAGGDGVWPSAPYTQLIEQRLDAHHFRFFHQRLSYAGAGHDIGGAVPYLPQPDVAHFGGSPRASAAAKADLWPRILDFLQRIGDHRGGAKSGS